MFCWVNAPRHLAQSRSVTTTVFMGGLTAATLDGMVKARAAFYAAFRAAEAEAGMAIRSGLKSE
jgi:hypothetical protein